VESVVPAEQRIASVGTDPLARCPDRVSLVQDLTAALTAVALTGDDLTLAVLEVASVHRPREGEPTKLDETQLLDLLDAARRAFGDRTSIYRVADDELAVLGLGQDPHAVGARILQMTCLVGLTFNWGIASTRTATDHTTVSPIAMLAQAESDLAFRSQEMARVIPLAAQRRRLKVIGSVAAALLVFTGVGVALSGSPAEHPGTKAAVAPSWIWHPPARSGSSSSRTHLPTSVSIPGLGLASTGQGSLKFVLVSDNEPAPAPHQGPGAASTPAPRPSPSPGAGRSPVPPKAPAPVHVPAPAPVPGPPAPGHAKVPHGHSKCHGHSPSSPWHTSWWWHGSPPRHWSTDHGDGHHRHHGHR
jgi:hypothetical protein